MGVAAVRQFGQFRGKYSASSDLAGSSWSNHVAILMWGASAGAGAAVARGVGDGVAAPVTVAVLVVAALAINLWMLPYPWWFEVGSIVAVSAAMAPSMRSNVH